MTRTEYHNQRRKKFAELRKNRVDTAYEFYCSLSDEDKQIAEFTFACKLAAHMGVSMRIARHVTTTLIEEYKVEFVKHKRSAPSYGFTGHSHSAKTRAIISKTTTERNKKRAIMCKEQGMNYRHYKQEADAKIEVADFGNNTRIKTISSDKIIIQQKKYHKFQQKSAKNVKKVCTFRQ